jgi:microcystin-dependent protein
VSEPYWVPLGGAVETVQSVPPGVFVPFLGASVPDGWLLCDGSAVSRVTYSDLFAAIGTAGGPGDGSTTFNLPDLRGRIPVGRDAAQPEFDTLGETGGAKTHTLAKGEMPVHNHGGATGGGTSGTDSPDHAHTGSTGWQSADHAHGGNGYPFATADGTTYAQGGTGASRYTINGYAHLGGVNANHYHDFTTAGANARHSHSVPALAISNDGSGTAHNNLQPYLAVNYIIKT